MKRISYIQVALVSLASWGAMPDASTADSAANASGQSQLAVVIEQPPWPDGPCNHVVFSTEGHFRTADDFRVPQDTGLVAATFYPTESSFPTDPNHPGNDFFLRIWNDDGSGHRPIDPPLFVTGPHNANDGTVSFHLEDIGVGNPDSVLVIEFDFAAVFFTARADHKYWIGVTGTPPPGFTEFGIRASNCPSPPTTPIVQDSGNGWATYSPHLYMAMSLFGTTGAPPSILHQHGLAGQTAPFSGYIDPRKESSTGATLNQGLITARIRFSQAVTGCDGSDISAANFIMHQTGVGAPPNVVGATYVNDDRSYVQVLWNRPIALQEWTTLQAVNVCGAAGPIVSLGDMGDVDEPDRIDFGFLPADVNQDAIVTPLDLLRYRQFVYLIASPTSGTLVELLDFDRNGNLTPGDLLTFKRLIAGIPPSTQAWAGKRMNHPRP